MRSIVHVCCGAYQHALFGGVPRYAHQISRCFPDCTVVRNRAELLCFLQTHTDALVIADNHYALMVPDHIPCIVVHHGCAAEHVARSAARADLVPIAEAQGSVWHVRMPENTQVISISTFCTDMFTKHYGEAYTRFPRILLPHASEHDERVLWSPVQERDDNVRVLGNFKGSSKGEVRAKDVGALDARLCMRGMHVLPHGIDDESIADFERRKQALYAQCDVFLQLSVHEGNSYATLDALAMGMPVVATDVGAFYKDVPENAFVRIPWNATSEQVRDAIFEAHANAEALSAAARAFYMQHWRFDQWTHRMRQLVGAKNNTRNE